MSTAVPAAETVAPFPTPMDAATRDSLFHQAVTDHMGIFVKTACGFTVHAADRKDLVQEILLTVWQALPAYHGGCKLSTYLYRIAHNRALNWRRSRIRYDRKLQHLASTAMVTVPEDGAEGARRQRQLDWLYGAIRQLPPPDRTLILLHLDQLPHRDIADITGLSEGNVAVRLHRIKHALTAQLPSSDDL